jgi:ABC-2 type transport system permease protein
MSLRRLWAVCARDLAHNASRSLFYIWVLLLIFLTWGLSAGNVGIQSGDSSVGGTKAITTSEFAVAQLLLIFVPLIYGFFVSVTAGMAVIQDEESNIVEVLNATPLRPFEYIGGKFLAAIGCALVILTIHLGAMILFNHGLGSGEKAEFRGPLILANYVKPALFFALPTLIFLAGAAFAMGEWTRKPILIYFLPVAVFLACTFFLWRWSPSWLDPSVDRFLMLIDPSGYRWLNETQLKVDRGVQFYNNASIPLDSTIVANRLLFLALGLGAVALSRWHFASTLRGRSRRAERAWREHGPGLAKGQATLLDERPLASLGMTSRSPGLIRGAWAVMGVELLELRSSPGLYLFIPLLVLQGLGPTLVAVGPFDTPLLQTSGTFASNTFGWLTTMICMLLLFYTVESLWRERKTRLAAISLATPIKTGSILIGKTLANSVVGVVILGLEMAVAVGLMAYQGKVKFETLPFALVWGCLLVPTLLLWTSFVMATLSITRSRYITYGIALFVLGFTGFRLATDEINWVGNWPLWGAFQWSDLSILEMDRTALILNRGVALGLTVLFTVLTARYYTRRDPDAVGVARRLHPYRLIASSRWLLLVALIPISLGFVLWVKVDSGYQGSGAKKLEKDYWRKNLATYKDWPLPDIRGVEMAVDLEPSRGRLKVQGWYDLKNNHERPLTQIPLTIGLHWESPEWTIGGKPETPANRSGLYVFSFNEPLQTGRTIRLGFRFQGHYHQGISKKGGGSMEFILPSGVVLTSFGSSMAPVLGFGEGVGIDDENRTESKEYADDYYLGQTESFAGSRLPYPTKITIKGPADFTYNSVGTLKSNTIDAEGRRVSVWETEQPVNFFNIVAGRWEVQRGQGTAVYFSPKHPFNINEMVEALDAARKYYGEWFRPYPWNELKLSEFPAMADYAQGFATDITFSESIGFLTRSNADSSVAFMVTAHESAHQWWGNLVAPGKGPGGNLISEGGAHFSTLLLFEQVKGLRGRIEFARKIEDTYAKTRSADSERSLVKTDGGKQGDNTVTYDKTGWVLWMLMNQMGRDRMLAGIKAFFETYRDNPDHPVLQDFLASLRPHAADPAAFDAFTKQWFYEVVIPSYKLTDFKKVKDGEGWRTTARLQNVGTGRMPVEVAATRGKRFPKEGVKDPSPDYRDARQTVTLGAKESSEISIRSDFEPDELIVDPDAKVLMLDRKAAVGKL